MGKRLVIIPTYNEIENIEPLLQTIFSQNIPFDVLVVDDNSPDGTAGKIKALQSKYPENLYLEVRSEKSGLGTAYIHGFKWALQRDYGYIFQMDADFSHNPRDLSRLYKACNEGEVDLAIGSRYISGINVINWPMKRVLLSWTASKYVKLITGLNVHDATAGFVCYKREVLEKINLDKIQFVGYAFQIEMKFKTKMSGFALKEIPIIFTNRTKGKSKMSSGIFSEAFFGVIKMKIKSIFGQEL